MSARCTGMVFDRYPAGGGEFALALALADNAHDDGTHIFPSVDTMARKSRQDVRSVQRHLKRMQADGWLILVKPAGGRGRPAEYRISPRWLKGFEDLDAIASTPVAGSAEKGDKTSPFSTAIEGGQKGDKTSPIAGAGRTPKRVTTATQKGDKRNTHYKNRKEPYSPQPPEGGDAGFDSLLAEYPKHRRNIAQAFKRWQEIAPDQQLQAVMVQAARAQARSPEWQTENGKRVPNLSKWLLNHGWRVTHDETEAPAAQTAVTRKEQAEPALTPEQLQANRDKARQLLEQTRKNIAADRLSKREAIAA
jgi:hypothetical protein